MNKKISLHYFKEFMEISKIYWISTKVPDLLFKRQTAAIFVKSKIKSKSYSI